MNISRKLHLLEPLSSYRKVSTTHGIRGIRGFQSSLVGYEQKNLQYFRILGCRAVLSDRQVHIFFGRTYCFHLQCASKKEISGNFGIIFAMLAIRLLGLLFDYMASYPRSLGGSPPPPGALCSPATSVNSIFILRKGKVNRFTCTIS
jgi:hypothetical protein